MLRQTFLSADVGIYRRQRADRRRRPQPAGHQRGQRGPGVQPARVQIVCATIDKVLPRPEDATALLRLLVRSATGRRGVGYTSFYAGPRREDDQDGPDRIPRGAAGQPPQPRSWVQPTTEDMLHCMRCGACMNHCPIYIGAGGHAYGWVYPGPMGSVLTPLLTSLEQAHMRCPMPAPPAAAVPRSAPPEFHCPTCCGTCEPRKREQETFPGALAPGHEAARPGCALSRPVRRRDGAGHVGTAGGGRPAGFAAVAAGLPTAGPRCGTFPHPQGSTFMQQWRKRREAIR